MGAPTPFINQFDTLAVGSLRYNTSMAGQPLPIAYGTTRLQVNLLEFWGFTGGPSKGLLGNKGGSGPGKTTSKKSANYSVNVAFGICQGPASFTGAKYGAGGPPTANRIWANAGIAYGPTSVSLGGFGGFDGQASTPQWVAQDPNVPLLSYSGTCYVSGAPMELGSSPALPNISFEMRCMGAGTMGTNFPDDARPDIIVTDLLSNSRYGAGFPVDLLDWSNTPASATLTFTNNPTNGEYIILNGITWTFVTSGATGNQTNIMPNQSLTLAALVTSLTAATQSALTCASYARNGAALVITYNNSLWDGEFYTVQSGTAPCSVTSSYDTNFGPALASSGTAQTGSIGDFGNYCLAASLAMSLLLDRCQPASRWIEEICQLTVAAPFWTSALFKIVPYSTAGYNGNGITWNPNLTAQYLFTDSDYIDFGGESDPVIITRSDPSQATNWLSVEYWDSSNSYNPNISFAFDQGAIDQFGVRLDSAIEAHSLTNITTANISAYLQLLRKQQIRNTFKWQARWNYCLLDPMDIVELTDSNAGLNAQPVRITSITENDNGELTFEAEELPGVPTAAPLYSTVTPTSAVPNPNALPGNVNTPIIFEPNSALTNGALQLWIGTSGGADWGGCNVLASTDGQTYAQIGTIFASAPQGVLTANLAAYEGSNPDITHTLSVNLTESQGQLLSTSAMGASTYATLSYCDGELLAYETATLTGTYNYNITTLYRGLFGTTSGSHAIGASFIGFGLNNAAAGFLKYPYPMNLVGVTVSLKFLSFNTYGVNTQSAASVTTYTYVLTGNGASLTNVSVPISTIGIPQNAVPVVNYTFGQAASFPSNFASSVCTATVGATSSTTFTIYKNGVSFGTMTFGAVSTSATFSSTAASFGVGDILTITPNRTDATLSGLTGVLIGTT